MSYKLSGSNRVQRVADGAALPCKFVGGFIYADDWHSPLVIEFAKWIAAGNTPEPADPPVPPPTPDELEAEVQAILNGGAGPHIEQLKLFKAKFISDLAFRLGVAPSALTGAQLAGERNRIAMIYKAL